MNRTDRTLLIVAACRYDNPRVAEWIRHHRSIGATKLVLYDFNDPDGDRVMTLPSVKRAIEEGFLDVRDARNRGITEAEAFTEAYRDYGASYSWVLCATTGEYLWIPEGSPIQQFLGNRLYDGFDLVHIGRDIRTRTGIKERPLHRRYGPSCRLVRYLPERAALNRVCRSMVRGGLKDVSYLNGHTIAGKRRCCNVSGKTVISEGYALPSPVYSPVVMRSFTMGNLTDYSRMRDAEGKGLDLTEFFVYNPVTEERLRWLRKRYGDDVLDQIDGKAIEARVKEIMDGIESTSHSLEDKMGQGWLRKKQEIREARRQEYIRKRTKIKI